MTYSKGLVASIKCNGKILRDNDNIIYIPFLSEYSILFKNLTSKKCCISIEIDGEDILNNNKIIINSNETQEIERFFNNDINKGHKFKFIKKTEKIIDFRGDRIDDGIIRIEYQFEKENKTSYIINEHFHYYNIPSYPDFNPYIYYNNIISTTPQINNNDISCNTISSININEGITVRGNESHQSFSYAQINELEDKKYTIIFKLNGYDNKNNELKKEINVKDKLICNICGTLNKSFNKYCRECGTYLL